MQNVVPYLFFNGNCREAMHFYKEIFGGNLDLMDFNDAPGDIKEEDKKRIMHAYLNSDGIQFMASDSDSNHNQINFGNNVSMCINLDDTAIADNYFSALSSGGKVVMPMENTFWGAYFGMLTDRFGQNWMISCEKTK